jgi:hypothetical protein
LIIVSAMNAVIEVFVEALWYSVFMENIAHHNLWEHHNDSHHHSAHH